MHLPQGFAAIICGLENSIKFPDHNEYPGEGSAGYQKYIHSELRKYNKKASELKQKDLNTDMVIKKKRPSVQENINNKGQELLGDVDYAIDTWDIIPFDMYKYLSEKDVSSAVANSIVDEYDSLIKEIKEARTGDCKPDSYTHLTLPTKRIV